MNKSLLDITQKVLAKLSLEPVNSIVESEDALDIAREAENTFYDLLSREDWTRHKDVLKLEAFSDPDNPISLVIPESSGHINELRLDITDSTTVDSTGITVKEIEYLEPYEFRNYLEKRNSSHENVEVVDYNKYPLLIINDEWPMYWSSFDDKVILFDSYDKEEVDTLISRYAFIETQTQPVWSMSDDYQIDVPDQMYSLYLSELTAACSIYLNEEESPEDERRRNRGISTMRRKAIKTGEQVKREATYGRTGNGRS